MHNTGFPHLQVDSLKMHHILHCCMTDCSGGRNWDSSSLHLLRPRAQQKEAPAEGSLPRFLPQPVKCFSQNRSLTAYAVSAIQAPFPPGWSACYNIHFQSKSFRFMLLYGKTPSHAKSRCFCRNHLNKAKAKLQTLQCQLWSLQNQGFKWPQIRAIIISCQRASAGKKGLQRQLVSSNA